MYRKSTHTNQYLNFNFNHPVDHKFGVIHALYYQASFWSQTISTDKLKNLTTIAPISLELVLSLSSAKGSIRTQSESFFSEIKDRWGLAMRHPMLLNLLCPWTLLGSSLHNLWRLLVATQNALVNRWMWMTHPCLSDAVSEKHLGQKHSKIIPLLLKETVLTPIHADTEHTLKLEDGIQTLLEI